MYVECECVYLCDCTCMCMYKCEWYVIELYACLYVYVLQYICMPSIQYYYSTYYIICFGSSLSSA